MLENGQIRMNEQGEWTTNRNKINKKEQNKQKHQLVSLSCGSRKRITVWYITKKAQRLVT